MQCKHENEKPVLQAPAVSNSNASTIASSVDSVKKIPSPVVIWNWLAQHPEAFLDYGLAPYWTAIVGAAAVAFFAGIPVRRLGDCNLNSRHFPLCEPVIRETARWAVSTLRKWRRAAGLPETAAPTDLWGWLRANPYVVATGWPTSPGLLVCATAVAHLAGVLPHLDDADVWLLFGLERDPARHDHVAETRAFFETWEKGVLEENGGHK